MTRLVQSLAAVQQQEKNSKQEQLVKNASKVKMAPGQNQSCGVCRAMKSLGQCKGHGKNNGSGNNGILDPVKDAQKKQLQQWIKNFMLLGKNKPLSETNDALEYESDFFTIHSNKLTGRLVLQLKFNLLAKDKKDIEEYLEALKLAFNDFKAELEKKGIDVSQFNIEETKNAITFTIPAKHFSDYLQHLGKLNLLPELKPRKALENEQEKANVSNVRHSM